MPTCQQGKLHQQKCKHHFPLVFQFHGAPDFYEVMLKNLNIVFTTLFSLECILKIIAFGPLVGNIYKETLNVLDNKQQLMIFNCCFSELPKGRLECVWLCDGVGQHHRHPGDWNQCKSTLTPTYYTLTSTRLNALYSYNTAVIRGGFSISP